MKTHRVRQGETLSGIAKEYGFVKWEKLWSENSILREKRKSPHLLLPGDEIQIPELESKEESSETGKRHRFRVEASVLKLKLILRDLSGEPFSDLPYILLVGGKEYEGNTDGKGSITHPVPLQETDATLILKLGDDESGSSNELRIPLKVGSLDPADTLSGVQARLNNIGFESGPVDGIMGPLTEAALRVFQEHKDLEVTSKPDEMTQALLEQAHGC